jgi:hypothetical protein
MSSAGTPPDIGRTLPGWAQVMAGQFPAYTFATCDVFRGRAVAAVRMRPGSGPHVVITSRETEMRAALGTASGGQPEVDVAVHVDVDAAVEIGVGPEQR